MAIGCSKSPAEVNRPYRDSLFFAGIPGTPLRFVPG